MSDPGHTLTLRRAARVRALAQELIDGASRAECVMLNKGPFIVEAIGFLHDVLERMQGHQSKKKTLLRRLHSWGLD